jgi:hypothetical protein
VRKAAQGDVAAIKEVLDRIDGKTFRSPPKRDRRGPSPEN